MINDAVYQGIADQSQSIGTLGHGFTGTEHAVATAVALENLKIIEEEGLVQHAAQMGIILRKGLQQFADHPMVGEVRGVGLIAAVELVADRHTKEPFEAVGRLAVSVLSGPGAWNDQPSHGRCIGILSSVDLNGEGYQ